MKLGIYEHRLCLGDFTIRAARAKDGLYDLNGQLRVDARNGNRDREWSVATGTSHQVAKEVVEFVLQHEPDGLEDWRAVVDLGNLLQQMEQ